MLPSFNNLKEQEDWMAMQSRIVSRNSGSSDSSSSSSSKSKGRGPNSSKFGVAKKAAVDFFNKKKNAAKSMLYRVAEGVSRRKSRSGSNASVFRDEFDNGESFVSLL